MPGAGHTPQRTCLGCRQVREQESLVRFVLSPRGEVLVDYRKRLPGRGAYACLNRRCLAEAVNRRQFERTFKRKAVQVPAVGELTESLLVQMRERILNLVGMGRKSRSIVAGSGMVLEGLTAPSDLALILVTEDISDRIAEKVFRKAQAARVPVFRLFAKGRLGPILGKAESSVVAFRKSRLAQAVQQELLRYERMAEEH